MPAPIPTRSARSFSAAVTLGILGLVALGGCSHELDGPKPDLVSIDPTLACAEQVVSPIAMTGTGFSPLPTKTLKDQPVLVLPAVTLAMSLGLDGSPAMGAPVSIPDDPAMSHVRWASQQAMSFDVFPELMLPPGVYDVTVANANGHADTLAKALGLVERPKLAMLKPVEICTAQFDNVIEATGTGFLKVGAALPTVSVGTLPPLTPIAMEGCVAYAWSAQPVEVCTGLTFGIVKDALPPGKYDVVITNPAPAACKSTDPVQLEVAPPPTITSFAPTKICDGGGDVTITGTGFLPGATVKLGGMAAASVTVVSGTEIQATFAAGLTPGMYTVEVQNADGCKATSTAELTVVPGPIIFAVDPPVVWNGIATQVTIWGTGLTGAPTKVSIQLAGMPATRKDLTFTYDPTKPHRVQAIIPKDTVAGSYDVVVLDPAGCLAVLAAGLKVVSDTTLMITRVDPPFGEKTKDTAVTIFGDGTSGGGFKAIPRAYLNPTTPTASTVATSLRGVAFLDASRLTGVVPGTVPEGVYDVIVINPDGTVGRKAAAFTVTVNPPPVITAISPGSVDNASAHPVTLTGSGFRAGAAVTLSCQTLGSTGAPTMLTATVSTLAATSLTASMPVAGLTNGTACLIRVTNTDGTFGEYSALAITNPSANLEALKAGKPMVTARRALALVAGRATSAARFLYAVGGDAGTEAGALDTVESVPVDAVGAMGDWSVQSYKLPTKLTLAGAAILGRLIYVVGGDTGAGATSRAFRAEILDPTRVPGFDDLDITKGGATGLGKGTWIYRITALMASGDDTNPGGETLPSEPIVVQLPDLADKLKVKVTWTAVAGAGSYRVYRTPMADQALGNERLLAYVPSGLSYEDTGTTPAGAAPLPLGSTGKWKELAMMSAARAGAGVALAPHPTDASKFFLYAIGGKDAAGTVLTSYDYLPITSAGPASHTLGSWSAVAGFLPTARWQFGAYVATPITAPNVAAGTVYVYAAGGRGMTGTVADVDAASVSATGALAGRTAVNNFSGAGAAGYGAVLANNFLFTFGGAGGAPSGAATSAEICASTGTGPCTGGAPKLASGAWNSLGGIGLAPGRYLMGSTLESAFVFLVGGATDVPEAASKSTMLTVW